LSTVVALGVLALCFLFEGFFSGSEIALVSADRFKLRGAAEAGSRGARLALNLLDRPAMLLGACLVGTNLCTITAGTVGASMVHHHFGLPSAAAALLVFPFTLTIGEMVPKAVYQHHADRLATVIVFPLRLVVFVLAPLLWAIELLTRLLSWGADPEQHAMTRGELRLLLEQAQTADVTPAEQQLIKRVFAFTDGVVRDAMVPLIEVTGVPDTATCAEAAAAIISSGHSRLPVFDRRIDRISHLVRHQDLVEEGDWSRPVMDVSRPVLFVPETKRIDDLLTQMRLDQQRMAVAVDEYGGAVGLITVEDLLEEIVGDIEDESDPKRALVRRTSKREWMASGRAEREHIEGETGLALPDGDFETVAGYVLWQLGRIPDVGDQARCGRYALIVARADDRTILEVQIRRDR